MENYGFDNVYLQEVMVPHWERGDLEECFFYSNDKRVDLKILGAGGTVSTPKDGVTAEVVEVSSLEDVEKLGKEIISGKIVFYNKGFNPRYINQGASYGQTGFQRRLGAIKAAEYGAVASVFRSLSSIKDDVPHTGGMSYSNEFDSIPHGALGVLSSIKLSEELKKNPKIKVFYSPDLFVYHREREFRGFLLQRMCFGMDFINLIKLNSGAKGFQPILPIFALFLLLIILISKIEFINKIAILSTIIILINVIIFFDIKKYIKNLKMLFLTLITINLANLSFALGGILTFLGLKKIIVNKTYLVSRQRKE